MSTSRVMQIIQISPFRQEQRYPLIRDLFVQNNLLVNNVVSIILNFLDVSTHYRDEYSAEEEKQDLECLNEIKKTEVKVKIHTDEGILTGDDKLIGKACAAGYLKTLFHVFHESKQDVNQEINGILPLSIAISSRNLLGMRFLINECDANVDINRRYITGSCKEPPLATISDQLARESKISEDLLDCAHLLILSGAKLDRKIVGAKMLEYSITQAIFDHAVFSGDKDLVKLILSQFKPNYFRTFTKYKFKLKSQDQKEAVDLALENCQKTKGLQFRGLMRDIYLFNSKYKHKDGLTSTFKQYTSPSDRCCVIL